MRKHVIAVLDSMEKLKIQQYIASVKNPNIPMNLFIEISNTLVITPTMLEGLRDQLEASRLSTNNKDLFDQVKKIIIQAKGTILNEG